eukprot:gene2610-3235_t
MATPLLVGLTVAGLAYATRFTIRSISKLQTKTTKTTNKLIADLSPFSIKMTKSEAYDILELPITATKKEIRDKHRTLIHRNHPDKGGSQYLATKINQAKNVLTSDK